MSSVFKSMNISSSGLAAQRLRMNVLSSNLANAQTTKVEGQEGPYKRKDVVFSAVPEAGIGSFESFLDDAHQTQLSKVKVVQLHEDNKDPRRVYDPSHPDADQSGYISLPNIDVMSEMVNMITATRSYEANVTAMNNAKQMALKALEIGR